MTSFNSRKSWCLAAVLTAMVWAISASSAWAHHPMDGKTPTTLMQGLLSGFGHPVIGPDHFAFIIALGTAAALLRSGMAVIGAFITASTAGVMIHLDRFDLPMVEALVALSVIAAGFAIAMGRGLGQPGWLAFATLAGLVHGYAFGEAVVGAERGVVGAYLVGLAVVTAVVASGVMVGSRKLFAIGEAFEGRRRAAGAVLSVVGVGLLALSFVGI